MRHFVCMRVPDCMQFDIYLFDTAMQQHVSDRHLCQQCSEEWVKLQRLSTSKPHTARGGLVSRHDCWHEQLSCLTVSSTASYLTVGCLLKRGRMRTPGEIACVPGDAPAGIHSAPVHHTHESHDPHYACRHYVLLSVISLSSIPMISASRQRCR